MGKKGSNPPPPIIRQSVTMKRIAGIFNEWNKRYAENPDNFGDTLDKNGNPIEDYGERCAVYFTRIAAELDEQKLLPK
jgi:hypothetical protein